MSVNEPQSVLKSGLTHMGIKLSSDQQAQLMAYAQLLAKWSKAYNLTTVREVDQIIPIHLLDSLSILPFMDGVTSVLDVGTGAGLPGIPLAIARPDISFKLLDSQQKKINFVQHVITSLQLTNVTAIQQRIEALQVSSPVGMVVARAFSSLAEFVNLIHKICDTQTKIVAMKGRSDLVEQDLKLLPPGVELVSIEKVQVPGVDAERCLVFLKISEGK